MLLASWQACALPMGSQGTWMVMGDHAPQGQELAANYAVTRRDAFGLTLGTWNERMHAGAPGGHMQRRDFSGLTYTRQLQRWNLPDAQANLWLIAGAGSVRAQERGGSETLGTIGVLADYETTRLYAAAGMKVMRAGNLRHDTAYTRAGFSFYEVEYEDVQPWFILEAKRERYAHDSKQRVTPMLRFIHRRYFVEVGRNTDATMVNFMLNF